MLQLVAIGFAIAGAAAALGPIVIHLLNRRRYRTLDWAAMDFLREALQRSRRILQWRDMLLLALRVLCMLLFGLALAQPYFAGLKPRGGPLRPGRGSDPGRSGPGHLGRRLAPSLDTGRSWASGAGRLGYARVGRVRHPPLRGRSGR